jgi:hypothetical protein
MSKLNLSDNIDRMYHLVYHFTYTKSFHVTWSVSMCNWKTENSTLLSTAYEDDVWKIVRVLLFQYYQPKKNFHAKNRGIKVNVVNMRRTRKMKRNIHTFQLYKTFLQLCDSLGSLICSFTSINKYVYLPVVFYYNYKL